MKDQPTDVRTLGRATLARQLLLDPADIELLSATERLVGLQAQEAKPPHLGLWTRLRQFGPDELRHAVQDRRLVRATMMRATLHLVTAADYLRFRPTLQPVLSGALRVLGERGAGLDVDAVLPVARELFAPGPLTFEEVRDQLVVRFPDVNERALGYAVRMCLPLVMVPSDDPWGYPGGARFTLADAWLETTFDTGAPTEELVRRYLAAYGPASPADFQAWSGLTGAKTVFDGLRDELVVLRDPKRRELFDLPDAPRPDAATPAPARFLPEFDSLVLAHNDRSRFVADAYRGEITTKGLRVRATFWWDGRIAGTWEAKRTRKVATLRMRPFEALPAKSMKALTTQAEPVARFVEPEASTVDVIVE